MEEILDRETKIEKPNVWITIIASNIFIIFVISIILFSVLSERLFEIGSVVLTTGLITLLLWNIGMTCKLYFSSSSDWKKWATVLAIILTLIFGAFLYLYLVVKNL